MQALVLQESSSWACSCPTELAHWRHYGNSRHASQGQDQPYIFRVWLSARSPTVCSTHSNAQVDYTMRARYSLNTYQQFE
ncbi:hypothetical protein XFEB_00105 [Xylella fastidiosa EB92.1]|nr:hypothetical protein XFEB_00105 [Xylella fastidiosa EB92.1]